MCIRDSNGADASAPLVGRYCGRSRPNDVVSKGNKLYLRFKSDARNAGKGFKLSWEELKKEEPKQGNCIQFILNTRDINYLETGFLTFPIMD